VLRQMLDPSTTFSIYKLTSSLTKSISLSNGAARLRLVGSRAKLRPPRFVAWEFRAIMCVPQLCTHSLGRMASRPLCIIFLTHTPYQMTTPSDGTHIPPLVCYPCLAPDSQLLFVLSHGELRNCLVMGSVFQLV